MLPLALALLMVAAAPPAAADWPATAPPAIQAQQSASGLVIAEDVAGRVTVFDTTQRIVFEMDKDEGRPVRIGVAPGTYEVRLQARRPAVRITVQVRDGEYTVVDADRFAQPSTGQPQAAEVPPRRRRRHRRGPAATPSTGSRSPSWPTRRRRSTARRWRTTSTGARQTWGSASTICASSAAILPSASPRCPLFEAIRSGPTWITTTPPTMTANARGRPIRRRSCTGLSDGTSRGG